MHPRHIRRFAALAAGFLAAALIGTGGALAAPPRHLDPSPSVSDPAPTPADPTPSPSDASPSPSPTTSPSTSPSPGADMSVVGSSAKGHLGGTVKIVVMVHTAGVRNYTLGLPLSWGGVRYVGHCDSTEPRNTCGIDFTAGGPVDTRVLEFKIELSGTTRVPVHLYPKSVTDPNPDNNTAYATITTGTPGRPHDMAVTADNASGRVGEVVTVNLRIETSSVPEYYIHVPLDSGVTYVGRCEWRADKQCGIYLDRKGEVDTYPLKFKIVKPGKFKLGISVGPVDFSDTDSRNNTAYPVVEGLPANNGGGDNGGGDGDDGGLPTTGAPIAAVAAGGGGLLAVGVVLYLVAHRRRATTLEEAQG